MPSNNFQQFNPTSANQENDLTYAGDSVRTGGAPVNAIFPSALANKLFYQLSTMVAAIAAYIVGQGQNAQDGNLATLSTSLQAALANHIATISASIVTTAFSGTPTFDASQAISFEMTLTGNVTVSTLSNAKPGQKLTWVIHQDGVGGRAFAFPAAVQTPGTVDPAVNAVSVQEFIVGQDNLLRPLTPMTVS